MASPVVDTWSAVLTVLTVFLILLILEVNLTKDIWYEFLWQKFRIDPHSRYYYRSVLKLTFNVFRVIATFARLLIRVSQIAISTWNIFLENVKVVGPWGTWSPSLPGKSRPMKLFHLFLPYTFRRRDKVLILPTRLSFVWEFHQDLRRSFSNCPPRALRLSEVVNTTPGAALYDRYCACLNFCPSSI